jgi:predicted RecB family nuclease
MSEKKITAEVLDAFLRCKVKAHLLEAGEQGVRSDYEALLLSRRDEARRTAIETILASHGENEVARSVALTAEALKVGQAFVLDGLFEDDLFRLRIDGLKKVPGPSRLGPSHYVPVLFHGGRKVGREQRLVLELCGLLLAGVQGTAPAHGVVWHGWEGRCTRVALKPDRAEQLLRQLRRTRDAETPKLVLNEHCPTCEFRERCREQAVKEDNPSLLRGVGEKEVRAYARKGVLTLTQLAHTFRPRRKGKRAVQKGNKRHHALQALAIRDKRIYVFGTPETPKDPVSIFLDVEGVPDEGFVYLIGLVVCKDGRETRLSFWADGKDQEAEIFQMFLDEATGHGDFRVFCYGGYERKFMERMKKSAARPGQADEILKRLVNVLSLVHAHLYFPCHSNGLKDVASCLGCSWSEPDASGLQSIVWRARWEATRDEEWKRKLLAYNLEDCLAVKRVAEFAFSVAKPDGQRAAETASSQGGFPVSRVEEYGGPSGWPDWHDATAALPDFDHIRKCGYFDYQREKVYFRTSKTIGKACARQARGRAKKLPPNRTIEIEEEACPRCNSTSILRMASRTHVKVAYDLRFSPGGIRRVVVHCTAAFHRCRDCRKDFYPMRYKRRDKHLHGLKSWAMYQHVAHRISLHNLPGMFEEQFGLRVVEEELRTIKSLMAKRYLPTRDMILRNILSGGLLHIDETKVKLRQGAGYVWVLTNLEEVVYLFQPTREGDFLHELLKPFTGVLVSDFYAAYDSLPCKQQRCLIHLVRDFNADILKNPYDDELKSLGSEFGHLVRRIIATVDRHGLKAMHLGKHAEDVRRFFRTVASREYRSELAESYQARLIKNEGRLFTFLEHDGVPWNNNNAECAVKRFACYRRNADGMILEAGLRDYLVLLSVFQTCRYKGVSFLKFLLSGEQDVDQYLRAKRQRPVPPALEAYPPGYPPQSVRNQRRRGQPS